MFIVTITNTENSKTWKGEFFTYEEATTWKDNQIKKPGRNIDSLWFKEKDLSEDQILNAVEERLVEFEADVYIKEYRLPPQAEFEIIDITQQVQEKKEKEAKKLKGCVFRTLSQNILDIIAGHIYDNQLNQEQISTLQESNIYQLLSANMPITAKPLIDAITPDGTLITQLMLNDVQIEYTEYNKIYPDIVII